MPEGCQVWERLSYIHGTDRSDRRCVHAVYTEGWKVEVSKHNIVSSHTNSPTIHKTLWIYVVWRQTWPYQFMDSNVRITWVVTGVGWVGGKFTLNNCMLLYIYNFYTQTITEYSVMCLMYTHTITFRVFFNLAFSNKLCISLYLNLNNYTSGFCNND